MGDLGGRADVLLDSPRIPPLAGCLKMPGPADKAFFERHRGTGRQHLTSVCSATFFTTILALANPVAVAAVRVNSVKTSVAGDATTITVQATGRFEFVSYTAANPDRIFFDLSPTEARLGKRPARLLPRDGVVRQVNVSVPQSGTTRITVMLAPPVYSYKATRLSGPNRLVIEISRGSPARAGTAASADPHTLPPVAPVPLASSPGAAESAYRGPRIAIDPGHGGNDSGAAGRSGAREKDVVLDIALRTAAALRTRLGAEVVLTRSDDRSVPLQERIAIANREAADLFLSIHANFSRSPHSAGPETFFLRLTNSTAAAEVAAAENASTDRPLGELKEVIESIVQTDKIPESQVFAQSVESELFLEAAKADPLTQNRGVKAAPLLVLASARMPAALAEIGFLSNSDDEAKLRSPEYRQRVAEALYRGIAKFLNAPGPTALTASRVGDPSKAPDLAPDSHVPEPSYEPASATDGGTNSAGADASFEVQGVEWRIPNGSCLQYDEALHSVPEGYELADENELARLSAALRSRSAMGIQARRRIPFHILSESVWTNHRQEIADRCFVVRLLNGEIKSQVPDLCSYVLVRKSSDQSR